MLFSLPPGDALHAFAVRGLASLEAPTKPTKAALAKLRTAAITTLTAAGVDTANVVRQPRVPFTGPHHHLVVWNDIAAGALRVFTPEVGLLDDTTLLAFSLLNGSMITNFDAVPIEDVDAAIRFIALLGQGGKTPTAVRARFVAPNLRRYADDFPPPTVRDLAQLWRRLFPSFVGGTGYPLPALDLWIDRVFAFGIAWHAETPKRRPAAKRKPTRSAKSRTKR